MDDKRQSRKNLSKSTFKNLFIPFGEIGRLTGMLIIFGWALFVLGFWYFSTKGDHVFPSIGQVLKGFGSLYQRGMVEHLFKSIFLCIQSISIGALISIVIAFLSPVPILNPIATFFSRMRYLPLAGIAYFITVAISSGRMVQISILVIFMSLYFITSLLAVIQNIPQEEFDLARSLKCSRWETLWIVVVRSRLDKVLDVLRQNLAIAWMMLVTVESIMITSGGLGAMAKKADKHMAFGEVIAIQILILFIGLFLDWFLKYIKTSFFPYSKTIKF